MTLRRLLEVKSYRELQESSLEGRLRDQLSVSSERKRRLVSTHEMFFRKRELDAFRAGRFRCSSDSYS